VTTELRIRWLGHSAFLVSAEHTVLLDPFAIPKDPSLQSRGMVFDYPPIDKVAADLVLISHEHFDHNGSEVVEGSPQVIRSTAGKFDSCIGSIVAIAGEHDDVARTKRGLNTIFCFSLGGTRLCHLGDFGQARLRPEQERAIGEIDILFLSVGGGPTLGPEAAVARVRRHTLSTTSSRRNGVSITRVARLATRRASTSQPPNQRTSLRRGKPFPGILLCHR
jgi:L-ascorbate metabolism protein UlaG (beta-lactamase superfamily)